MSSQKHQPTAASPSASGEGVPAKLSRIERLNALLDRLAPKLRSLPCVQVGPERGLIIPMYREHASHLSRRGRSLLTALMAESRSAFAKAVRS